jgi:hypothetical protein
MSKLKTKISAFLKKVWAGIAKAWDKLNDEVKTLVPIGIQVTNAIKEVVREGSFSGSLIDVLVAKIKLPNDVDEKALALIRKWVPLLLTKLVIVKNINEITDPEDQLKAIIDEIKLFNDDQKEIFWDGFAKKFIEYAADGKITRDEVGYLVKWYYDNKFKTV